MCYYFHGKTVDNCRFTISAKIQEEGDLLILGASICSHKDNFSRKIGRTISEGRINAWLNGRVPKGIDNLSFYTDDFAPYKGRTGYPANYFVGQETKVIYSYVSQLNDITSSVFKDKFNL